MKVILLTGGLGTRLRPITNDLPKPLIPINGTSVLQHIINHLFMYGFQKSDIALNLHWKPLQIMEQFPDFHYLPEPQILGTAGTLKRLEAWLSDPFFVLNGDTISNINFYEILGFHMIENPSLTVFTKKDAIRTGGVYIFKKHVLSYIPKDIEYSIHQQLIPAIQQMGEKISLYKSSIDYYDIGTPKGLEEARRYFDEQTTYPMPKV